MSTHVRFAAVGLINTGLDFALFSAFFWVVGWSVVAANLVAFSVAALNSYVMNRSWVFPDAALRPLPQSLLLFAAVTCFSAAGATLVLWLLVGAGVPVLVAKALSVGVSILLNFTGLSRIVFAR